MKIDYIEDDEKLNTGGDLKQVASKINEYFLLIPYDSIIEVIYFILIQKFKQDTFLLFKKESNGKYFYGKNDKLYNIPNIKKRKWENFIFQYWSISNFSLSYVLKALTEKGKLFGQTITSPIFNLNSYYNFSHVNDYFLQKEYLIQKFCFLKK